MAQSNKMMWCCLMDKEGDGGDPAVIGGTGLKISAMHHHKLLSFAIHGCIASIGSTQHSLVTTRHACLTILGHPLSHLSS